MKKILAILLSAIMVFSLGLTAFAEGEDESTGILLPEFPAQTEGEIYFVSENTYVEAGATYDIPVYIVSNYTPSVEGYTLLGINFGLAGAAFDGGYMTITGIRASEEAQALAGFELIAADVAYMDDPYCNMFGFKCDDMSIYNQEAMPIAYVTVAVAENYPGYNEDGTEMDCQLDIGDPQWWNYMDNEYAMFASGSPIEITNPDTWEYETIFANDGVLYIVSGHVIQTPPVPTWEERLKAWAIEQAIKIITFFQGLNEVLLGLLPTL